MEFACDRVHQHQHCLPRVRTQYSPLEGECLLFQWLQSEKNDGVTDDVLSVILDEQEQSSLLRCSGNGSEGKRDGEREMFVFQAVTFRTPFIFTHYSEMETSYIDDSSK